MYSIPTDFANCMIEMYSDEGRAWLSALPSTLHEYAQRWSLTLRPPFPLSYNYVAPAVRADGSEAVLKLGFPNRELLSEMHALQLCAGRGMVRLLEVDFERQVFLLERIRPGVELVTVEDDEQATRIAAQVMQQLWRPVTDARPLLTVESWTAGLQKLGPHFGGTTGPFPEYLVDAAEQILAEFIPSMGERVLLHGDLHHWNILSATRQPWLALDPKGVIGEREYEVGALLRNPWGEFHTRPDMKTIQARRVDILSEMLGFERQRMLGWGMAQAVLSAWWSVEDHGHGWEGAIGVAEVLYGLGKEK
ncbi:MAG: aminoglycoside phosphotransferase family protein [Chloroflexi bacterium]|nr:aminoglycoside phosphotransferase family protein [Chloroflexota bacterium]MBU1661587.1 aminoglycoside phosphotransferase family protein [Chloroflexota bacterium]